jgi:hypothetical protein
MVTQMNNKSQHSNNILLRHISSKMNEPTKTSVFLKTLMFVKFYVMITCNVHEIVSNYNIIIGSAQCSKTII